MSLCKIPRSFHYTRSLPHPQSAPPPIPVISPNTFSFYLPYLISPVPIPTQLTHEIYSSSASRGESCTSPFPEASLLLSLSGSLVHSMTVLYFTAIISRNIPCFSFWVWFTSFRMIFFFFSFLFFFPLIYLFTLQPDPCPPSPPFPHPISPSPLRGSSVPWVTVTSSL